MLPQLAKWQAAGQVKGILMVDGEKPQPVSLGGYQITLTVRRAGGTGSETAGAKPAPLLAGDVSLSS
jgi:hypothetical protein